MSGFPGGRWWPPVAFVAACVLLGWLAVVAPRAVAVMVWAFYAAIVAGFIARIVRARRHRFREGLAPAVDAIETVQDMYLSRPRSDVTYGNAEPDLTLVMDQPEPDPGDLRGERPTRGVSGSA